MTLTPGEIRIKYEALFADNTTGDISEGDLREFNKDITDYLGVAQITDIIPTWTALLTFQTYASDDGEFCIHADTSGNIRIWQTKIDDNTGNEPPTDPNITSDTNWQEVSASSNSAFVEWSAGIYGAGLIIVFYENTFYKLDVAQRPYNSADIVAEIAAGDWVKITSDHDYKIWHVDIDDGSDYNRGGENDPFKNVQAAYTARIADGFTGIGIIKLMTAGAYAGLTATITTLKTEIRGEVSGINIGALVITDAWLIFRNIDDVGDVTLNQTSGNFVVADFISCETDEATGFLNIDSGTIDSAASAFVILRDNTRFRISTGDPDFDLKAYDGSTIIIPQGISHTDIEMYDSELIIADTGISITNLTTSRGKVRCTSVSSVSITDFTHTGTAFVSKDKITVTGTETNTSGEWADPHPDSLDKVTTPNQTIASNVEFLGQASANDDTVQSFSATPTFDFDNGNDQEMPVTGNVTSFSTLNSVGSANYKVWLVNDATAGRTVAAPTGWTKAASSDDHDTAANTINLYQFFTRPGGSKYYSILNI